MVWKVEERLDCAKTIVGTRRENYKEVQLSVTRDTLTLVNVSNCTKPLRAVKY